MDIQTLYQKHYGEDYLDKLVEYLMEHDIPRIIVPINLQLKRARKLVKSFEDISEVISAIVMPMFYEHNRENHEGKDVLEVAPGIVFDEGMMEEQEVILPYMSMEILLPFQEGHLSH